MAEKPCHMFHPGTTKHNKGHKESQLNAHR